MPPLPIERAVRGGVPVAAAAWLLLPLRAWVWWWV
jgi:hypothetical protein